MPVSAARARPPRGVTRATRAKGGKSTNPQPPSSGSTTPTRRAAANGRAEYVRNGCDVSDVAVLAPVFISSTCRVSVNARNVRRRWWRRPGGCCRWVARVAVSERGACGTRHTQNASHPQSPRKFGRRMRVPVCACWPANLRIPLSPPSPPRAARRLQKRQQAAAARPTTAPQARWIEDKNDVPNEPIKKTLAHAGAALLLPRSESRWHVLPPHSVLVLQRESADAGAGTNNADSSSISTKLSRLTASATARQGRRLAAGSRVAAILLKVHRNAGVPQSRVCVLGPMGVHRTCS